MAGDMVELIPLSEQDEAIYAAWETGKGLRTLARDFGVSVGQVEQALDRTLPAFDSQNQLRAFKRELRRLEDLSGEFYALAKRDKNHDSAHLFARLNERICSMRGWNAPIKMDPLTVQVAEREPHEFDRVYAAILGGKADSSILILQAYRKPAGAIRWPPWYPQVLACGRSAYSKRGPRSAMSRTQGLGPCPSLTP